MVAPKIGYAVAADIVGHPEIALGDQIWYDLDHFKDSPQTATVTNSGGVALFTRTNHGRSVNEPIDIDASSVSGYVGHFLINTAPSANTFTLKTFAGVPVAYASDTSLTYYPIVSNGFYIAQSGSHNEKNFTLGAGAPSAAPGTFAYDNHRSDGKVKYIHGDDGTNYTGPIGKNLWVIYPEKLCSAGNDGNGNVLITCSVPHNVKRGMYGDILNSTNYNGYYYFEYVNSMQFRLRPKAAANYVPYVGSEVSLHMQIVPGSSSMTGLTEALGTAADLIQIASPVSVPGRMSFRKSPDDTNNYGFQIFGGMDYFKITGAYNLLKGTGDILYQGWSDGQYRFRDGKFGSYFRFYNYLTNNSVLYLSGGSQHFEVEDTEIDAGFGAFAGFMAKTDGNATAHMYIKLRRMYVHNCGGEGYYIGNTGDQVSGSARTQHKIYLDMAECVGAYTGVESFQLGELGAGSVARNFVAFCASMEKYNPFTAGQGGLIQIRDVGEGNVDIKDFIAEGYSNNGLYINNDRAQETRSASYRLRFTNGVISKSGSSNAVFYDRTNDGISSLEFLNMDFYDIDEAADYDKYESQTTSPDVIMRCTDSATPTVHNNVKVDSAHSSYTYRDGSTAALYNMPKVTRNVALTKHQFVKTGWSWTDCRKIKLWIQTFSADHNTVAYRNQPIPYVVGDIFGYEGFFYYVHTAFTASATTPDVNPNCRKIYWDSAGNCSEDGANYSGTAAYAYPPNDFRLVANSYHSLLRRGLLGNEDNNTKTFFNWDWRLNGDTAFNKLLLRKDRVLNTADILSEIGSGNYVRRTSTPVDATGRVGTQKVESWLQINS